MMRRNLAFKMASERGRVLTSYKTDNGDQDFVKQAMFAKTYPVFTGIESAEPCACDLSIY